jgi:enamine deaminase RidA (YjgF/YER057c/UK114 family)
MWRRGRKAAHLARSTPTLSRQHLGSLDNVTRIVLLGGASELFESIFGKEKTLVRMVLGVASLPLSMPVELEVILEVAE